MELNAWPASVDAEHSGVPVAGNRKALVMRGIIRARSKNDETEQAEQEQAGDGGECDTFARGGLQEHGDQGAVLVSSRA